MVEVKEALGMVIKEDGYALVKKAGKKGDFIAKHNHPGANIIFTPVKGKVSAFINEEENFILEPGKVLHFDGDNYINAEFLEDSEVFITLISK